MSWTQAEAIDLCRRVEAVCPLAGCHVALTGGCLYKDGERKDCDILFYRVRQEPQINTTILFLKLREIGLDCKSTTWAWFFRGTYNGKGVDVFFPEATGGEYPPKEAVF